MLPVIVWKEVNLCVWVNGKDARSQLARVNTIWMNKGHVNVARRLLSCGYRTK